MTDVPTVPTTTSSLSWYSQACRGLKDELIELRSLTARQHLLCYVRHHILPQQLEDALSPKTDSLALRRRERTSNQRDLGIYGMVPFLVLLPVPSDNKL